VCKACNATNDSDASFCKKCGAAMAAPAELAK
jgi:ribosomal protein L40E